MRHVHRSPISYHGPIYYFGTIHDYNREGVILILVLEELRLQWIALKCVLQ